MSTEISVLEKKSSLRVKKERKGMTEWEGKARFKKAWLKDPILKDWISADPDDERRVICNVCNKSLAAHKKDLYHHVKSKLHQRKKEVLSTSPADADKDNDEPQITSSNIKDLSASDILLSLGQDDDDLDPDFKLPSRSKSARKSNENTPKQKKKYLSKRKPKEEQMSSPSIPTQNSFMSQQMTLEQAQSIQAVEDLLGLDLSNTLRGLGDIEIHIPMDEFSASASMPKIPRLGPRTGEADILESNQQIVNLTTDNCPITNVTVYKDRAEVCRQINTEISSGITEVRIAGFIDVDEDSIRVECGENIEILEVIMKPKRNYGGGPYISEKEKKTREMLKLLKEGKKTLDCQSKIRIVDRQWNLLEQYASFISQNGKQQDDDATSAIKKLDDLYFEGMKDFIRHYRQFGKQLDNEKIDVKKKDEEFDEKIKEVENKLAELQKNRNNNKQPKDCYIILETAENETLVNLKLSYVVHSAKWVPAYDIRMNTVNEQIKLSYNGLISQNSGEDWSNVSLTLSTSEPSGGIIPVLPQIEIDVITPGEKDVITPGEKDEAGNIPESQPSIDGKTIATKYPLNSQQVCVSYDVTDTSTIPSDNSQKRVTIKTLELKPELSYETVPKVTPKTFLKAKVVNTSKNILLPGKTNIFMDNSFVAKSVMKAVEPEEEFECCFGVDPGVKATYKPLIKDNATSGIFGGSNITCYEQGIDLKNLHNYPVKLTVKDRLPQPCEDQVKVILQKPHIDEKDPAKSEATLRSDNTLVWQCVLSGFEEKEITVKYAIENLTNKPVNCRILNPL